MLYYRHIFKTLNKFQLSYVIVGGIAVNLHGYDRLTGDIDIAISLTDVEIGKFIKAAKELSLVPRVPVRLEDFLDPVKREEWIQEKNMKVFSVYNPKNAIEHIDVMITEVINFKSLYNNSIVMESEDLEVRVVSIPDLIQMKKHAGRERDLLDIKALEHITRFKDA